MKILITGGSGFIGSNLANKLLELGHEVIIFDFQLNHSRLGQERFGRTLVQGDVLDHNELTETWLSISRPFEILSHNRNLFKHILSTAPGW